MEEEEASEMERFLEWAAKMGISDHPHNSNLSSSCLGHSLSISHFPNAGGRGLAAVRDLRKGELILRVPKAALITTQSIMIQNHKLSLVLPKYTSLSSIQKLTVALLAEAGKGKSSWWFPYLKHLPHSYDILASFGEFERQALQVDEAIWVAEKATAKAALQWREAITLMDELKLKQKLLTFKAWLWASATISSRTLHIPWDEAGCLCPVGDLFNYAAPGEELLQCEDISLQDDACLPATSCHSTDMPDSQQTDATPVRLTDGGYEEELGAYCFYARKSYRKGEQALLSYGTYTNLELLEHYGFVLDENSNDKAYIPLELEMYSWCSWPSDSLYIHQTGKPSFALLSTMRLWATPPNQRKSVGHLACSGSELSKENEIFVMNWIAKKCHLSLKDFQTSIKEDNLLLGIIDGMHRFEAPIELEKLPSTIEREIKSFLDGNCIPDREVKANAEHFRRSGKSIDKWKLAIQWRLEYKNILLRCVSYCIRRINDLSL